MQIHTINIKDITPYENNPRKNKEAVEYVANSIREFGIKQPLVIDKDNVIVVGHTRYQACKKLKINKIPCVYADDLTDEQIKAYRIADNSTGAVAEWDLDLLKVEIDTLPEIDFKVEYALDVLIEAEEETEIIEDEAPEVDEDNEPIAKLGDIWQLGKHRLMCGDSTDAGSVALLMSGQLADMVFTDPPYGVDYKGINNDDRKGLYDLLHDVFQNYKDCSKIGSSFYCFHSDKCADIFQTIYRKFCHFSSMIIWKKKSLVLSQTDFQSIHEPCLYGWFIGGTHKFYGDRKQTSVWEYESKKINGHTTPKPIGFISKAINLSSKQQDNIIDLFGGSGSTLIACEQTNRICYMMELDPKYVDVIIKRWENLTGKTAELISEHNV